jgi:hypothetical protein
MTNVIASNLQSSAYQQKQEREKAAYRMGKNIV